MIDFNNLVVRRLIIHTINPKQDGQDTASAEYSNEILEIEENVLTIIKVRLIDAAGRNSKAFELQIENSNPGSFYNLTANLNSLSNDDFINSSSRVADLLADSQRKTSIPGGYLIIMNCVENQTNLPVHIVIKAEPT